MKTFKRSTVQQCIFFQDGERGHLLVKVRGRGWFRDTRGAYQEDSAPPTQAAVVRCIRDAGESAFEKVAIKTYRIPRRKKA
jgi:hypothetical protein